MYKNKFIGEKGLIPITNLRSMATPKKFFKKMVKYWLVWWLLKGFLF